MANKGKVAVIINTHSRQARKLVKEVQAELKRYKFNITETHILRHPRNLEQILEKVVNSGIKSLIVGGGDGTLIAAVNALANTKVTLGLIPLGTTNNFARSLGIPLNCIEAVGVIEQNHTKLVNLGKINDHYFTNIAAIGLSVTVAKTVSNTLKRRIGRAAYFLTGMRWFIKHRPFKCEIKAGGKTHKLTTHQLLIANGRYHGALPVTDKASVYNDRLTIVALGRDPSRWQHLKNLILFARGEHKDHPDTLVLNVKSAEIITKPRRRVETDGEVVARTPITATVDKKALRVFVPKPAK